MVAEMKPVVHGPWDQDRPRLLVRGAVP